MNESLYNGMICCIHVSIEREVALTAAIESTITFRCDNPILKLKLHFYMKNCIGIEKKLLAVFALNVSFVRLKMTLIYGY